MAICFVAAFRSPFFIAAGAMVIEAIVRIGPASSLIPDRGPSGRRPPLLKPFITFRCTSLLYQFSTACLFSNHAKITCLPLIIWPASTPSTPGVAFNAPTRSGSPPGAGAWAAIAAGAKMAAARTRTAPSSRNCFIRTSMHTIRTASMRLPEERTKRHFFTPMGRIGGMGGKGKEGQGGQGGEGGQGGGGGRGGGRNI